LNLGPRLIEPDESVVDLCDVGFGVVIDVGPRGLSVSLGL
jgi:hypothetical protein